MHRAQTPRSKAANAIWTTRVIILGHSWPIIDDGAEHFVCKCVLRVYGREPHVADTRMWGGFDGDHKSKVRRRLDTTVRMIGVCVAHPMRVRVIGKFCNVRRRGRGVEGVMSGVRKTFGKLQIHIQRISDHTFLAILAETDVNC